MSRVFNEIHFSNLRGDLFGGVTAAVIALPMALAFGVASGAGAEAGLYGAILVGLFAALFGGSPTLISEPTGPMTVVFTAVIAELIASNPENGMAMAFTVVVMAGLFQIMFGALRLGKYVTLMPYTVVSGFMSGIGVILMILQFAPLIGHATPAGGVQGTLESLPSLVTDIKLPELALALLTLAILFLMPTRFRRVVPPQLVALVGGTLVSLTLLGGDIRRIGEIPTGLPSFQMPVFSADQWRTMLIDAAVLGMLGCIDALLTSVIADSLTKQQHNSDKELFGQGIGNVMSGLFGGLPGAGATMGTVVNIQAGGRTALSGLVRAAILLVVVLGAARLTATIPLAVLAGIAVHVGFNIVDWGFLKRAHRLSGKGSIIMYGVLLLTVFQDLIVAVGVGLFVANVITIRRLSELFAADVKIIEDPEDPTQEISDQERAQLRDAAGRVTVLELGGPLIFGTSKSISSQRLDLSDGRALVIDLSRVSHLGVSSSLALEELVADAQRAATQVHLVVNTDTIRERLERLGLISRVPAEHVHATRERAIRTATKRLGSSSEANGEH